MKSDYGIDDSVLEGLVESLLSHDVHESQVYEGIFLGTFRRYDLGVQSLTVLVEHDWLLVGQGDWPSTRV